MNTSFSNQASCRAATSQRSVTPDDARNSRRPREFGIGYGSSSGYGRGRPFAPPPAPRLFRLV